MADQPIDERRAMPPELCMQLGRIEALLCLASGCDPDPAPAPKPNGKAGPPVVVTEEDSAPL